MTPKEWEEACHQEGDMWPADGEIASVILQAILEEREACAKTVESTDDECCECTEPHVRKAMAAAIRARTTL